MKRIELTNKKIVEFYEKNPEKRKAVSQAKKDQIANDPEYLRKLTEAARKKNPKEASATRSRARAIERERERAQSSERESARKVALGLIQ